MIKACIFDLDNTLYNENDYIKACLNKLIELESLSYRQISNDEIDRIRLFSTNILKSILEFCDYELKYYDPFYAIYKSLVCQINPYKDACQLITYLKKNSIITAILTNGIPAVQRNKIKCLAIKEMGMMLFFARELGDGDEKPKPIVFKKACELLSVKPLECLYVGDHPIHDFQGAKKSGLVSLRLMRGRYQTLYPALGDKIYSMSEIITKIEV